MGGWRQTDRETVSQSVRQNAIFSALGDFSPSCHSSCRTGPSGQTEWEHRTGTVGGLPSQGPRDVTVQFPAGW